MSRAARSAAQGAEARLMAATLGDGVEVLTLTLTLRLTLRLTTLGDGVEVRPSEAARG